MVLEIFSPFLILLFLLVIAIGCGNTILYLSPLLRVDDTVSFRLGASYFIGVGFFIVGIRLLAYLGISPKLAVLIVLCISILLIAGRCKSHKRIVAGIKNIVTDKYFLLIFSLFIGFCIVILFRWLPGQVDIDKQPLGFVGSLHSVRYAWVSNYILANNYIPILSQNTGQSILAYIGGALTVPAPFLYLYLWLVFSILFLSLFVYGFLRSYVSSKAIALYISILFMFGNTALSIGYVLTIDSGSPFAMNGYTDTLIGVFSIIFILILNERLPKYGIGFFRIFLIALLIAVLNFLCAPQNILYICGLAALLILMDERLGLKKYRRAFFWFFVVVIASIIAIPLGGMLTPKKLSSVIDYSGLLAANLGTLDDKHFFGFHVSMLGVRFMFVELFGLYEPYFERLVDFPKMHAHFSLLMFFKFIWALEQRFIVSLRVMFFPIIGILTLLYWRPLESLERSNHLKFQELIPQRILGVYGVVFFLTGFIICFVFDLNGRSWELSRFLIPGIVIGMIGMSIATAKLIKKTGIEKVILIFAINLFMLFGPILCLTSTSYLNLFRPSHPYGLKDDFKIFVGVGPKVSQVGPRL